VVGVEDALDEGVIAAREGKAGDGVDEVDVRAAGNVVFPEVSATLR
jgi:hypothetical protein